MQYATIRAAASASQSGDTIHIAAGEYRGDVAQWSANNLTICGIGGRARLFADGVHQGGKGIWVVTGSNTTIHSVEFHGAKVSDQNGAGIRQEGPNLTLRDAGFYDNENGILGGTSSASTVTIEYSEFARNGYGDGYSHNIYIGTIGRLNVRASYFHEAKIGHNLKSRARETYIENSYFMDGPTGTASYLVDTPNGGVVFLRGNLFQKGPRADNSISVAYGQEGLTWTTNTLTMVHNTLVSTRSGGTFINAPSSTQQVTLRGNIFAGTSTALIGGYPSGSVIQQNNYTTTASNFVGADSVTTPNFWPSSAIQAQLALTTPLDPDYVSDTPSPLALRAIAGTTRIIGALQSQP
jgi:hypothetical protein